MQPKTTVELDGQHARQNLRLIETLEDHDDVQRVTANFDIPDDVLAEAWLSVAAAGAEPLVIVLGIDPGTAMTGYGIVERDGERPAGDRLRLPPRPVRPGAARSDC